MSSELCMGTLNRVFVILVYAPLAKALDLVFLGWFDWVLILVLSIACTWWLEIVKLVLFLGLWRHPSVLFSFWHETTSNPLKENKSIIPRKNLGQNQYDALDSHLRTPLKMVTLVLNSFLQIEKNLTKKTFSTEINFFIFQHLQGQK